ncbi:thiamine pyrophosphate-binding protein [Nocardioides insulae]|uniref:thiamine pyrophosphate-binding protein n=1 Tax=Nocardioides insulae TaxID=394734 RepID=UPI00040AEBD2|nr:thiamine pyrophosphate-binding protein [Nocardioides insulae]
MTVTGGELLARALHEAGTTEVFTLHGGHLDAFYIACEPHGIRLTDTRHESSAGHAADAYARLTGRPGVCVTTSGPGFTNTLTAITNAYLDAIPTLFVVGAPPLGEVETNPLQGGFDQIAMAAPVTKWAHRVTHPERIPELVGLALQHAVSGKPGPVLLEVPIDVLFRPVADSLVRMPAISAQPTRSAPTGAQVADVLAELSRAERPVIVTGGGAMLSGCSQELAAFAERFEVPVFTPNKGDGILPASHRLWAGGGTPLAMLAALGTAPDLVILLGIRTGMFTGGRHGVLTHARIVQVDLDAAEIGRMHDVAVGLVADCGETLRALLASAPEDAGSSVAPDWVEQATRVQHAHRQVFTDPSTESGRIHPYFAAREIAAHLPERTVAILDGGEAPAWVGMHLAAEEPGSVLRLGYLGCLGVGQGFAVGAHRAAPERPILLVTGDGSAAFHIAEFDTMVRHGIPAVTVVFNNLVWGMSIHGQEAVYGEGGVAVTRLADSAYEQTAVAFGGYGERIGRLEDLGPALEKAFLAGVPVCLNVEIAPEVVHPITTAMLGDVTSTTEVVVPYYQNLPL